MSQDIIKQIKAKIEQAAEEKTKHLKSNYDRAMARMDFQKGANFILPLLEKAIEQRDTSDKIACNLMNWCYQDCTTKENNSILQLLEKR